MGDRPRSGRPVKLTQDMKTKIVDLLEDPNVRSLRKAKRKLEEDGIELDRRTISRGARQMGKKYRKRKKKPFLTPLHMAKRLTFARSERKKGPQRMKKSYIFYDESLFKAFTTPAG